MCEFYSCIVLKSGKVLDSDKSNRHEDIIEENKLDDTKVIDYYNKKIICNKDFKIKKY